MIKFFRRIRQQLLSENKFSKYLIYALGEIVLVVIGILIALQLNNLNASIKINKEEKISLYKLHKESEAIVENLRDALHFKDSIILSMDKVAAAFEMNNFETIDARYLEYGLEGLGYYPAFNLPNSVYNELYNSGKLQNIKSEEVQKSISSFYSNLEFTKSQLDYFRSSAANIEIDIHTDPFLYVYDASLATRNRLKVDLDALMSDQKFKSRQLHGLRNQIVFRTYISDLMNYAEIMCRSIAAELKTACTSNAGSEG